MVGFWNDSLHCHNYLCYLAIHANSYIVLGLSLPEIRCVVLGVALVTVERHTVKPPNKRHFDISSVLFLEKVSNCFTQDEVGICRRFDCPGSNFCILLCISVYTVY